MRHTHGRTEEVTPGSPRCHYGAPGVVGGGVSLGRRGRRRRGRSVRVRGRPRNVSCTDGQGQVSRLGSGE